MVRKRRKLTAFGKAVKKAAVDKDVRLADVAKQLGISCQQLTSILCGERPGYKYRNGIVKILGLPPKWREKE